MARVVVCKQTGYNRDFVTRGNTDEELLKTAAEHGKAAHNLGLEEELQVFEVMVKGMGGSSLSSGLAAQQDWIRRVRAAIKEE